MKRNEKYYAQLISLECKFALLIQGWLDLNCTEKWFPNKNNHCPASLGQTNRNWAVETPRLISRRNRSCCWNGLVQIKVSGLMRQTLVIRSQVWVCVIHEESMWLKKEPWGETRGTSNTSRLDLFVNWSLALSLKLCFDKHVLCSLTEVDVCLLWSLVSKLTGRS